LKLIFEKCLIFSLPHGFQVGPKLYIYKSAVRFFHFCKLYWEQMPLWKCGTNAPTLSYISISPLLNPQKKLFSLVSVSLTNFYHTAKCQKYCSDFVVCEELTTGQQPEARFVYAYSVNCIKCICIWLIVLHTISLSNIHKSVYIYQYCYISNRLSWAK